MKKSEVTDRYLRDCNLVLLIFATVVHDYFESDEYKLYLKENMVLIIGRNLNLVNIQTL